MNFLKTIFKIEKTPRRGLLPIEWLVLGYMALTLTIVLFTYTQLTNPQAMIWGRVRIGAITVALWAAYRLVPCRVTRAARVITQLALLAWWYPDTYEINRMFDNLDHVFAAFEQQCFGCQPALLFAAALPSRVVSELMSLGYASYYPMIAVVVLYYFACRYDEFERVSFVVLATFFTYYMVFIFVPVAGPTFYFKAVGTADAARGVFPALHGYFNTHTACMPTPGYTDGFFYQIENHGTGHTYVFVTDFKRMPVRRVAELRQAPAQGIIYTDPSQPHRRIVRMFSPDWKQALRQEGVEQVTLCRDDTHIYINGVAFKMRRKGSAVRNPATGALADMPAGNDTTTPAKPVSSTDYEAEAEAICTRLDELMSRIKGNTFAAPADLAFVDSQLPAIYKQIALTRADIRKLLYNE